MTQLDTVLYCIMAVYTGFSDDSANLYSINCNQPHGECIPMKDVIVGTMCLFKTFNFIP